jgi:transposase InsO family protein
LRPRHITPSGIKPELAQRVKAAPDGPGWLHEIKLDRDAARRDLFAYIEGYYNRQRIHSAIGYITPDQAEAMSA